MLLSFSSDSLSMQDIIHLLPDSVANQIAAGEVVQRPSSVVKELMENSVDAGARSVSVLISDSGRTLIQVIDDGKGMSAADARLAFERHATSKIKCAEDLFALSTMGFRGEALASIVAVAQVELVTRRECDELGTKLHFSGSQFEAQEPVTAPVGCNIKVKNLFYNIPARRKFLKSPQTEFSNIVTEFERVALVNNNVQFSLMHNGTEVISLPVSSFRQRILTLFGKKLNSQLIEVAVESPLINVKGFVGTPESSRKKGALQFFFVNGRYMRHGYFAKAVSEAYGNIIPQGEQVPFFLHLDVEPSRIDVNIHPTKTEIKFEDEAALWKIISAAVRESLGRFNAAPSLDFDDEMLPDIPVMESGGFSSTPVSAPKISYNPGYNPFKNHSGRDRTDSNWEMMYDVPCDKGELLDLSPFEDNILCESGVTHQTREPLYKEDFVPLTQYKGQYILIPVKSGLMWVDQRRAHIRILYERYLHQLEGNRVPAQGLLFPERVELTINEGMVLETVSDKMASLGFDFSSLGGSTYALNGVPSGIDGLSPVELFHDLLHSVMEKETDAASKVHERMALSMARKVAVVVGQVLSVDEMKTLVDDLFSTSMPSRTPDGAKALYIMPDADIEHFF